MSKHPSAGAVLLILCHHSNLQMPNPKIPAKHRECNKNIWHTVGTTWHGKGHFHEQIRWTSLNNIEHILTHDARHFRNIRDLCQDFKCQTTGVKKMVRKKHCLLRPKNHWFTAPLLKHPTGSEIERGGRWILEVRFLCKPWYLQCFLTDDSFAELHFASALCAALPGQGHPLQLLVNGNLDFENPHCMTGSQNCYI